MRVLPCLLLAMLCAGCPRRVEPPDAIPLDATPLDATPLDATPETVSAAASTPLGGPPIDAGIADASSSLTAADTRADAEEPPHPFRREDWEVAIGKWTFEENGEVSCECKATSSLLWWKASRPKDFDASVEVYFPTVEASAGIIFRSRGEDFYEDATFYQFEWYTRGSHHDKRLSLMKKNPYWVQIVTPTFPEAPLEKWVKLRVRAVGDRLVTWVGDEQVFDKADATFLRTGKVGLHVFQPRKIRFRDFRLTVLTP